MRLIKSGAATLWVFAVVTAYLIVGFQLESEGFWIGGFLLAAAVTATPFVTYAFLPEEEPSDRNRVL